jgi:hypothetical protein
MSRIVTFYTASGNVNFHSVRVTTSTPPNHRAREIRTSPVPFNTYILFVDAVHGSATDLGPGWAPSPSPLLEGPAPREGRVGLQHNRNTRLNACMHASCKGSLCPSAATSWDPKESSELIAAAACYGPPESAISEKPDTQPRCRRGGSAARGKRGLFSSRTPGAGARRRGPAALQLLPALKHRMAMWRFGRRGEQVGDVVWTHGPVKT